MRAHSVGRDLDGLRRHYRELVRTRGRATAPRGYAEWLGHLMEIHSMIRACPAMGAHLDWWEIKGLAMMEDVLAEIGKSMKTCPRCGEATKSIYDCETCGARLN